MSDAELAFGFLPFLLQKWPKSQREKLYEPQKEPYKVKKPLFWNNKSVFILFYFFIYFFIFIFIFIFIILFYFILFYFIFYFILFYFILFYFILFYFILFYFILFYFILFYLFIYLFLLLFFFILFQCSSPMCYFIVFTTSSQYTSSLNPWVIVQITLLFYDERFYLYWLKKNKYSKLSQ